MPEQVPEISVAELKRLLATPGSVRLIDVREAKEWDLCRIEGAELLPLSQWPQVALDLTDKEQPLAIHCHHGGRSARAAAWLISQGFKDVKNVAGGIEEWSLQIDPAVPRYE